MFKYFLAQNVTIPDANFKNYLVTNYGSGGEITVAQAEAVTYINCTSLNIADLTALKPLPIWKISFAAATYLSVCQFFDPNQLEIFQLWLQPTDQSADLSALTNLRWLYCNSQPIDQFARSFRSHQFGQGLIATPTN